MRGGFLLHRATLGFAAGLSPSNDLLRPTVPMRSSTIGWELSSNNKASFCHCLPLLPYFGVAPFEQVQPGVLRQAIHFARQQMNPVVVLRTAADYLRFHRWPAWSPKPFAPSSSSSPLNWPDC